MVNRDPYRNLSREQFETVADDERCEGCALANQGYPVEESAHTC